MKCRHCSSMLEVPFLDLGTAPPSNAYLTSETLAAAETWLPLRVLVCTDCWLVQTEDFAAPESMFTEDYAYFSSFSSSWLEHANRYVQSMRDRFGLTETSMVCEVAANDGYLLQYVKQAGVPCYGVEPTAGTAAAAREKGIEIVPEFFGVALAERLVSEGKSADLTAANNVLAHVPDINDFVGGFAKLLKPSGVSTFEFPHLLNMIELNQFDTAYHEHFSYLSLIAVQRIFAANGLTVFDVEEWPTHGGSLRVFAQRTDTGVHPISPNVAVILDRETAAGLKTVEPYLAFQARAEKVKDDFVAFLLDAKAKGLSVAAYGAAAKGNTLINFAGVTPELLPYVVDKNPAKQGKYLPGSRIPIVDEDYLREHKPDRIVILPWNLKTEVKAQLSYARGWGAMMVTAAPWLEILPWIAKL
jgi:SAM-dependent methyltransferase